MARPIIEVQNLSKRYRLGEIGATSLRETFNGWRDRFKKPTATGDKKDFWALRDVNFEVQAGEVVGILGRNGAGKSTLLKILSRITEPTSGRAIIRGRVASLLEVGTGFHPELSGRENIFLNGAILGMRRGEILRKFDEIVAFSEVEQFIDTPVKRYSSGMYVRLAFAVAAHLDPEVLIVDEVLAVGDAQFQQKCIGKMKDVASGQGRTVLFVSHNMAAINALCTRGIWLHAGRVKSIGSTYEVVSQYLLEDKQQMGSGERDLRNIPRREGDQQLRFIAGRTRDSQGEISGLIENSQPFSIEFDFEVLRPMTGEIGLIISSHDDVPLIRSSTDDAGIQLNFDPGLHAIRCEIAPNHLKQGRYNVLVGSRCGSPRDLIENALKFEVIETRSASKGTMHGMPGHLHFDFKWRVLPAITHSPSLSK